MNPTDPRIETIKKQFLAYIEWHGAAHERSCPEDDTCDCKGKPINDGITKSLTALESVAAELASARDAEFPREAIINQALEMFGSIDEEQVARTLKAIRALKSNSKRG